MTDPDMRRPFNCYEAHCGGTVRYADVTGLERGWRGVTWTYPPGTKRFQCDRCGGLWFTLADCEEDDALQAAATRRLEKTP